AAHWGIPVTEVAADGRWPLRDWPAHGPDRDDPYLFVYQPLLDACLDAAAADGCGVLLSGDGGDEVAGDWIHDLTGLLQSGRLVALAAELRVLGRRGRRSLVAGLAGREPGARERRSDRVAHAGLADRRCAAARRGARAGLSTAEPWSDRRVVEFTVSIPQHVLHRLAEPKRLVRRALRRLAPVRLVDRMGPQEPAALFDAGFRGPGRPAAERLLAAPELERRGYLPPGEALRAFEAYADGGPIRRDFWWPLSLEWWLREHAPDRATDAEALAP
ncbi:MAG: asparagine synthase-related protein, partial [Longimicrobiales bacterium]|nr:asparagine synthase-related protein [Longimicrobiales bacterium]